MTTELVRYEEMRMRLYNCVTVDEAAEIRDVGARLAAYYRIRDDKEREVWASELHKRAIIKIGLLSIGLETAAPGPQPRDTSERSDVTPKHEVLKAAGVSRSTANEYEQLAGGKDEAAQRIAEQGADAYLLKARETLEPATVDGLRTAIRAALVSELGEPPAKEKVVSFRARPDPLLEALVDLSGAIRTIAELPEPDMTKLAGEVHVRLIEWELDAGERALPRLERFLSALRERKQNAA